MKGVVFTGNRKLELREFPDPEPGGDEVVIEIRASGMCGSDLHVYRAPECGGFIAGHEPCGVVVARGSAVPERIAPRDSRMMVHHYDGCRCCPNCLSGWTQLCDEGSVVYGRTGHGAHARYMKIPTRTLVPLPDALSFVEGAAISCGTGTAYGALRRMKRAARIEKSATFEEYVANRGSRLWIAAASLFTPENPAIADPDVGPKEKRLARKVARAGRRAAAGKYAAALSRLRPAWRALLKLDRVP